MDKKRIIDVLRGRIMMGAGSCCKCCGGRMPVKKIKKVKKGGQKCKDYEISMCETPEGDASLPKMVKRCPKGSRRKCYLTGFEDEDEEAIAEYKSKVTERRKKAAKKAAKKNPWIEHVKDVMDEEGISYKEALKVASETYTKTRKAKKVAPKKQIKPVEQLADDMSEVLEEQGIEVADLSDAELDRAIEEMVKDDPNIILV